MVEFCDVLLIILHTSIDYRIYRHLGFPTKLIRFAEKRASGRKLQGCAIASPHDNHFVSVYQCTSNVSSRQLHSVVFLHLGDLPEDLR